MDETLFLGGFFPSKSQLKGGSGERERSVGSHWSCWGGSCRMGSGPARSLGDVPTHGLLTTEPSTGSPSSKLGVVRMEIMI